MSARALFIEVEAFDEDMAAARIATALASEGIGGIEIFTERGGVVLFANGAASQEGRARAREIAKELSA
jgi:hypothetical protein